MSETSKGLIEKFHVERRTESSRGIDHSECRYFVLDPLHDPIARQALLTYERAAREQGDHALADGLYSWRRALAAPASADDAGRA